MNAKTEDYVEPMKRQLSQKVQDVQNRVTDTARKASYATDRYVRENPWITVGVVALAACMLGWMLRMTSED